MEDASFIYFTDDSILEKIDIDPRLVDSFKRVINKIQSYFNANGYTAERNYKEYLEEFLLNSSEKNLRFYVNKIEPANVVGFYDKEKHEICINVNRLNRSTETLDATLCHEFIHFLVMHALEVGKADPDIIQGGFINEALTEMLTQQMYPTSRAYDAQVAMQKFANLVSGNTNNFRRFLRGNIDARYCSPDWENFREHANGFQNDFEKAGYITLAQAQTNDNFIKAQRRLISLFIRPYGQKSIDEYIDSIKKLIDRPVQDSEFIHNTIVAQLDKTLISSLRIKDANLQAFLLKKLQELKRQIVIVKQNNGKLVYEFEFEGKKLAFDSSYHLYGNLVGVSRVWNQRAGIMTLEMNGNKLNLNVNEIDFHASERNHIQKIKELSRYFAKESSRDLSYISQASKENGKLMRLEKFTIPVFVPKTKSMDIYVATYKDRIVILDNASKIGNIENLTLNKYIGMTSNDPNVAAIYADKIGIITKGTILSTLGAKAIEKRAKDLYIHQLEDLLSQEQINQLIASYKNREDFFEDTEENIRYNAVSLFAEKEFESLSDEEKNQLFETAIKQSTKFVISTKDGKIDVSYVFGDRHPVAYQGNCEVLYDSKRIGMYNEVYDSISRNIVPGSVSSRQSIPIDNDGNIIFPRENMEEDRMMENRTSESFLAEYTRKIEKLREQYEKVAHQMEELMKRNAQNPISSYREQLNKLIEQRDDIINQMDPLIESQRFYQHDIEMKKEAEHKAIISQVERLLDTRITDTSIFEYDRQLKVPRVFVKDSSTLRTEQGLINKQLDDLYYDGQLGNKRWQEMKKAIREEYDKMIKNAPQPQSQTPPSDPGHQSSNQTPSSNKFTESFDRRYRPANSHEKEPIESEKENPSEDRRDTRRAIWQQAIEEKYGTEYPTFDLEEILRQQEMNELQRQREFDEMQRQQMENMESPEHPGRRIM